MEMVRTKESRKKVILRPVGCYRELRHEGAPSLRDAMQGAPGAHEQQIVNYLRHGILLLASPGPVWDALDGSGPIGTASVYTDGVWAWAGDLPHYVERYHLLLPEGFMQDAARNGWQVPEVPVERLRLLALR
jgi:hypothetical protein